MEPLGTLNISTPFSKLKNSALNSKLLFGKETLILTELTPSIVLTETFFPVSVTD
jgi:hypothetical protein